MKYIKYCIILIVLIIFIFFINKEKYANSCRLFTNKLSCQVLSENNCVWGKTSYGEDICHKKCNEYEICPYKFCKAETNEKGDKKCVSIGES